MRWRRHARTLAAIGWWAGLAAVLAVLHGPAAEPLRVPLGSIADLSGWAERVTVPTMAMALVRLIALAAAWYLVGGTTVVAVASVVGLHPPTRVAARLAPAVVRQMLSGTASLGLAGGALSALVPTVPPAAATPAAAVARPVQDRTGDGVDTATMTRLPDLPEPEAGASQPPAALPEPVQRTPTATMTRLSTPRGPGSAPAARTTAATAEPVPPRKVTPPPARAAAQPAATRAPSGADANSWIVAPGDSFWSIAADACADALGTASGHRVVDRYWRNLIDANRVRLTDPANPDLLVPGQRLALPVVEG